MSEALLAYNVRYAVDVADDGVFVDLAEVTNVTFPNLQVEEVDVTHYTSPDKVREFIAGFADGGEMTVELNWVPGGTTDETLRTLRSSGAVLDHRITLPNDEVWTFPAFVKGLEPTAPLGEKLGMTVTMRVAGAVAILDGRLMPNRLRGEVAFKALDREWILNFGVNTFVELETVTGKTTDQIMRDLEAMGDRDNPKDRPDVVSPVGMGRAAPEPQGNHPRRCRRFDRRDRRHGTGVQAYWRISGSRHAGIPGGGRRGGSVSVDWLRLFSAYVAAGFTDVDQFWLLTPRELMAIFEGVHQRLKQEHQASVTQAWLIEALHRQTRLPPLAKMLEEKRRAPQTPEEMSRAMRAWQIAMDRVH